MQLSPFRCWRRSRCFSVIPEIFHEEYNQTLSDSDRAARCYVSCEVHTDYIEHFLHVKAGRNSLLQGVIAGSWLFKTKTSKASDLTCPQLTIHTRTSKVPIKNHIKIRRTFSKENSDEFFPLQLSSEYSLPGSSS